MPLSSPAREIPWTFRRAAWSIRASVEAHHKAVGERLRELRKAHGFHNQPDAAHHVGVDPKTWGDWERGLRWPYETNWKRIAEAFNLDAVGLAAIKGTPPAPLGLGAETQLDRIERKIDALLNAVGVDAATIAAISEPSLQEFEAQAEKQPPTAAPPGRKPKPAKSTVGRARKTARRAGN